MDLNDKLNQIRIRDIIIIYFLSFFLVSGLIFIIIKLNYRDIGKFIVSTIVLILQLLICLMLLLKIKPSRDNILSLYNDFKKKIKIKELVEVTFIKVCISIGGSKLILSLFYFIDPILVNDFVCESTSMISSFRNYVINLIILILISPIVEEVVFRGVILNRTTEKFNMYIGIVVSSMVFSSFYAGSGIAGALALGIINSILYIKYSNILLPIFVNLINNIILLISSLPLINKDMNDIIITNDDLVINVILGSILCVIGTIGIFKYINKNKNFLNEYNKL